MATNLEGKRIAILATNGFEEEELTRPRQALEDAGGKTQIVSPASDRLKAWDHTDWSQTRYPVDVQIKDANPAEYDALLMPGGVMNPDKLRREPDVQRFVRAFFEANKPVAAICHAAWTLIDAGVVSGRKLTSYYTLQTDLINAGAEWTDEAVVIDGNLVTSRNPGDISVFNEALLEKLSG